MNVCVKLLRVSNEDYVGKALNSPIRGSLSENQSYANSVKMRTHMVFQRVQGMLVGLALEPEILPYGDYHHCAANLGTIHIMLRFEA